MKFVLTGGGTGGHLFPAIALAEELRRRDSSVSVEFIGARGGLEEKIIPGYGYPLTLLNVEGIKGGRGLKKGMAVIKALGATMRAVKILRRLRPDGVIGSGAYSSAPVVTAARLLGIKTAVMEQNAMAGLTNRMLGRIVDRVYTAFPEAGEFFPPKKTVLAGNPMRGEIIEKASLSRGHKKKESRQGGNGKKFTLLIFGGSQGATAINAAFLDATEYLTDIWENLEVIHQTGEKGHSFVKEAYERKKLKVRLYKFIDAMAEAYASADLVVCRAGATSIAEITAFGLVSILVPYPFASDNHQEVNARCLVNSGGAVMIPQERLTGRYLAESIRRFYENSGLLSEAGKKALGFGRVNAAAVIVDDFMNLLQMKGVSELSRAT
ncbi:MAG: undecaprenyldiphospho-muramoylpentapeptide beta-N-acetylglucosaminyltransferase [Thermodesulfobacteriota bacterium]